MLVKIVGSLIIIGFFFLLGIVGRGLLGKNHSLGKLFPIYSVILGTFLIFLIFFG